MGTLEDLAAAMDGQRGHRAADLLCSACVELLAVDAAAISLVHQGANTGTLGASGDSARAYDELQFAFGEGPCLDAVTSAAPILVSDLAEPTETRWSAYTDALLAQDIRGVFAMPVAIGGSHTGALDLFRAGPGPLSEVELSGALAAAELAQLPLLDLLAEDLGAAMDEPDSTGWAELRAISRVEVNQATGVLIGQLEVSATEALVRLRAHAYAHGMSATDVARAILEGRLHLGSSVSNDDDDTEDTVIGEHDAPGGL